MKTLNNYNFWTMTIAGLFAMLTATENMCGSEVFSINKQLGVPYQATDMDELAFYNAQLEEFEHDCELEYWPEEDLESLLYEMSTEANPGLFVA